MWAIIWIRHHIFNGLYRTLTHDEVNVVMREIAERVKNIYGVEVR